MEGRDSNNSTWFMLRYPEHFQAPEDAAPQDPAYPILDENLFYDDQRGVLELLPVPLEQEEEPLSGLAVGVDGEIFRVDPVSGRLLGGNCGEPESPLPCEPQVLAGPRGLALDRRGYLYVADARAGRVVVLLPETGRVVAVLNGGFLVEPVDVATSPAGLIYVSDRTAGQIAIYTARHQRRRQFPAVNRENLPAKPRPIAVMVDDDRTVLVADANYPRLLHFSATGEPLADVPLAVAMARLKESLPSDFSLEHPETAFGRPRPRFLAGACEAPGPARDGGAALARVHRTLRLSRLTLGRRFAPSGIFISGILDGGVPGTAWHRVEVGADLSPGTALTVETATSDAPEDLDSSQAVWKAPRSPDQEPVSFTNEVPDQLIQSGPGRYLRLRISLASDGRATPSLRWVRVLYPRVSYLDLLPRVYRRDTKGSWFLERFLALFEWRLTRLEDRYEAFSRELNPEAAPREVIDWLACLIDLSFDPSWPLARRRALVAEAMALYRQRGTPAGLSRYVEIYTGSRPVILEAFLTRPRNPAFLGGRGSVLGCPLQLLEAADKPPDEQLYFEFAHRFTVLVYLDDPCEAETQLPVVDRIIQVNKPAHTVHTLCPIFPKARVGIQSTVGLDLVVGGQEALGTSLGGCPEAPAPGGSAKLGVDSVLGERRPSYVRPFTQPFET